MSGREMPIVKFGFLVLLAGVLVFGARGYAGSSGCPTVPDANHVWESRQHEGIPSVAVSPRNGRLWATWYGGPTDCEDSNNYVILATSADDGRSWKTVLVHDPDGAGPIRAFDPEVWVAPDGKLRWTWTERKVPIRDGENYRNSCLNWFAWDDSLKTVTLDAESEPTAPFPVPARISAGVMMCKPILLRDGAWLYPVAAWKDDLSARAYVSSDGGRTFRLRGGAYVPPAVRNFDEHSLVQLGDGSLRAYIRTANGKDPHCAWQSESRDGGRTWSDAQPCSFCQPSSRMFVRRLASGALLMVKNGPLDKNVGRNDLTAFVSDDDGRTWTGGLLLHKGGCSYPDGDQAADGTIYVVYDTDRTKCRINGLARFTEADVRAGRVVADRTDLDLRVAGH